MSLPILLLNTANGSATASMSLCPCRTFHSCITLGSFTLTNTTLHPRVSKLLAKPGKCLFVQPGVNAPGTPHTITLPEGISYGA